MPNLQVQIRLADKRDLHFIKDSWLKSTSHQYPNQYALDFSKHFQSHMNSLLFNSVQLVAYLEGESDRIISYLVYSSFKSSQVVHFAYTKADARKQGIVNQLLHFSNPTRQPVIFTHAPKNENVMVYLASKYIFDPSILKL